MFCSEYSLYFFPDILLSRDNLTLYNLYNGPAFLHSHFLGKCLMADFCNRKPLLKLYVYIHINIFTYTLWIYIYTHTKCSIIT